MWKVCILICTVGFSFVKIRLNIYRKKEKLLTFNFSTFYVEWKGKILRKMLIFFNLYYNIFLYCVASPLILNFTEK